MLARTLIRVIDWMYGGIMPVRRFISRDTFGYALCGALNMTLDIIWYYLIYHYIICEQYIHIYDLVVSPHIASLCVVFPITFFIGFWLNRHVAFRVTHLRSRGQLVRYAISVVGSLCINYVCMKFFVEVLNIWPTPAKMLTTSVSIIYSYLAARYFTFVKQ